VSRVVLGTAQFALREELSEDDAIATIHAAYDAGIRSFDTARAYARVEDAAYAERVLARALAGRADVEIATKGGHFRVDAETWGVDGSPAALRADVDRSARALGTDALDLYYLHTPDPAVPLAESLGALAELRAEGRIRRVGLSNVTLAQLREAVALTPVDAVQNPLGPVQARDREVLAEAEALGIRFVAYSPLGGGAHRDRIRTGMPRTRALAARRGVSFPRLVLAWLLTLSPAVSVITGAGRPDSARDSAAAASLALAPEEAAMVSAEAASLPRS
jgi:pyridoxine 4-dehydrogenase